MSLVFEKLAPELAPPELETDAVLIEGAVTACKPPLSSEYIWILRLQRAGAKAEGGVKSQEHQRQMSSVEELKDALKDTLDRTGALRQLKATLRAEILQALQGTEALTRPGPSNENLIVNELIREYLLFNGYRETLSVFLPETGQPSVKPFERSFLAEHLGIHEGPNTKQVPLLNAMVARSQTQAAASTALPKDASVQHATAASML